MATACPRVTVAIPVCNEVDHIEACLLAIDRQRQRHADRVVLLLNNCTDGTAARVQRVAPTLRIRCDVVERDFEPSQASAGFARSLAMRHAACGLAAHDVLITTDADGRVAPDWIETNLAAIALGADAVCGRAEIDPAEALLIPAHLHEDDARECRLGALIDEISSILDPDPHDPWPRHTEHSGASIAVTVAAWRRVGGMPTVASGEDRAFIERLQAVDAPVRHCPATRVNVSGRTFGRAAGGMADTIRRRIVRQDEFVDAAIEPAADRFKRCLLRARARAIWTRADDDMRDFSQAMDLSETTVRDAMTLPFFGLAWAELERSSPFLPPQPVRFIDLPAEIERAVALLSRARRHQPADAVAVPA